MSCERFLKKLSILLDGELSSGEEIAVVEHLKTCSACAATYAAFAKIDQTYRDAPFPAPNDHFIRLLVEKSGRKKNRHAFWQQAAAAIFVFVFGLTAGRLFFSRKAQKQRAYTADRINSTEVKPENRKQITATFPYRVRINDAPKDCYFVIENKADEKQWQEFLREYAKDLRRRKNKKRLHRYSIETIPAHFVRCGDF